MGLGPDSLSPCFVKKATVIGIIGNTQGVNNAKNPMEIDNKINDHNPLAIASSRLKLSVSEKALDLKEVFEDLGAPFSIVMGTEIDFVDGGKHIRSLQTM